MGRGGRPGATQGRPGAPRGDQVRKRPEKGRSAPPLGPYFETFSITYLKQNDFGRVFLETRLWDPFLEENCRKMDDPGALNCG